MNFVFVSPHFPKTFWLWCDRLKRNGVNVLGIGDTDYNNLDPRLQDALTEYYKVGNMENYDEMLRAVAFFTFKYGKIDWIESNTEYWLAQDAKLRTDFNITTGANFEDVQAYKSKSAMKPYYAAAGIPTARCHNITTKEAAKEFVELVGYPAFIKPDVGAGATGTFKLNNDEDFENFFAGGLEDGPYVMEEFVTGNIYSYDAVCDSNGDPLFESATAWPPSIADIVKEQKDLAYYVTNDMPEQLRQYGRAAMKSFNVKSRFVHMEFFCLTEAKKGLGEVGEFVGLEVNMRPAGGYTPDMMNFAHSLDVYQIWADMVTTNKRIMPEPEVDMCCAYAGRRDIYNYVHTHEEILEKYGDAIVMCERMPELFVPQMGNQSYTAKMPNEEAVAEFIEFVQARV